MGARYNMEMPDVLNNEITAAAAEDEVSKAEIIRKALQMYIVGRKAVREGNVLGIVPAEIRDVLKREVFGV